MESVDFDALEGQARAKMAPASRAFCAAGFTALVLTVDAPVSGWNPRAAREQHQPTPEIRNINMPGAPMAHTSYHPDFACKVMFPATWRELEWLVKRSPPPVLTKGVLRADDAMRCVDGGIRRGTDILKALALGARAVLIGRPAIWGLTVKGADGVQAVLEHLRVELVRAMHLTSTRTLQEATPDLLER